VFTVPIKHFVISIRTPSSIPHTQQLQTSNFKPRILKITLHTSHSNFKLLFSMPFISSSGRPYLTLKITLHTSHLTLKLQTSFPYACQPFRAFSALRYLAKAKKTRQQVFYYIRGSFATLPFHSGTLRASAIPPFHFSSAHFTTDLFYIKVLQPDFSVLVKSLFNKVHYKPKTISQLLFNNPTIPRSK